MLQIKLLTRTFFHFYFPLIVWLGVIFAFSSMSGYAASRELTLMELLIRKGAHVSEFFILGILVFRLVWRHFSETSMIAFVFSGFLTLLFASLDELHQYFVPFREARVTDIGIDSIGIGLALAVFFVLRKMALRRKIPRIS